MIIKKYIEAIARSYRDRLGERFWSKVQKSESCWLWTGAKGEDGRGHFKVGNKLTTAPRVSYELAYGPIPDGLFVLHSCDTPACVNPDHLRAGTHQENMNDRDTRGRNTGPLARSSRTSCLRGHPYDFENTYIRKYPKGNVARVCRACHREKEKLRRK